MGVTQRHKAAKNYIKKENIEQEIMNVEGQENFIIRNSSFDIQ